MVFRIPEPGAKLKKNQFEFQLGTEKFAVPKMDFFGEEAEEYLKSVASVTLTQREYVLGLVTAVDAEVGQKLRDAHLSRDQIRIFYDEWVAVSKVKEGESSASEGS